MRAVPARTLALALLATAGCGRAGAQAPVAVPRGELLFAAEQDGRRVLMTVPAAGGEARLVAADAARDLYPSPGGALAIASFDDGPLHVEQLVWADTGAPVAGLAASRLRHPQLSPDRRFVVVESDHDGASNLWRIDLPGGALTRLTDDPEGNFEPSLSPDGSRVVFSSSRDGDGEIYVMPAAGGRATRLTAFHRDDWAPAWSPDGAWIAFLSDRDGAERAYLMRPDGTTLRRVGGAPTRGGSDDQLTWSQDGRWLAYVHFDAAGAGAVHVVRALGGLPRRLSPDGANHIEPTWAPDGQWLAVVDADGLALVPMDRGMPARVGLVEARQVSLPRWRDP